MKLSIQAALVHNHYGTALSLLYKQFEEERTREVEEKMIDLFAKLNWSHCQEFYNRALPLKYPSSFRPL